MRRTMLLLAAVVLLLGGCAGSSEPRSGSPAAERSQASSPPDVAVPPSTTTTPGISMCADVMQAIYGGRTLGLGDCAALVGLRPTPTISLSPGERLTLIAPIPNVRPPVPTSNHPATLRMTRTSGSAIAVYVAGRPGTSRLVIDHPGSAVCVTQPAARCVVASVTVATG